MDMPQLRCAVYDLLIASAAKHPQAAFDLASDNDWIQFILDRSNETDASCKEAKLKLAEAIVARVDKQSDAAVDVTKLQRFIAEGAFFIPNDPEPVVLTD